MQKQGNSDRRKSKAKTLSSDRVSIKPVKHGAPGSGEASDKEPHSLGSWIRIGGVREQTASSSVTVPSHRIIFLCLSLCNCSRTAVNTVVRPILTT